MNDTVGLIIESENLNINGKKLANNKLKNLLCDETCSFKYDA